MRGPPRVIFAGTPAFAVPSLEALHAAGADIVAVYTQPDRRAGRNRRLAAPPVKRCAQALGLPVHQPERIRDAVPALAALRPHLLVVVAYGQILTQAVLDVPAVDAVNVHASLLPRWRGAAPIQRAIEAGDAETGVAIMRVVLELDAGPVYLTRRTPIAGDDTSATLHDRLATLGAQALVQALPGILDGSLQPVPQATSGLTYAHRIDKAEARVDWHAPAREIAARIRAFNPWPVCDTRLRDRQIRLWEAVALDGTIGGEEGAAGTVLRAGPEGIDVATGDGILRVTVLQAPGGRPLPAGAFLNANPLAGARFA